MVVPVLSADLEMYVCISLRVSEFITMRCVCACTGNALSPTPEFRSQLLDTIDDDDPIPRPAAYIYSSLATYVV
jgi:hypothetical protein